MKAATSDLRVQLDEQRRKVDVDHYDLTIREIVRMATEVDYSGKKELNVAPTYQRKFRWDVNDESRLVESIFLGLPVPPVFVAANRDGTWEVVDGLQRISTLVHYISKEDESLEMIGKSKPLTLKGLEKLSGYNGKTFHNLPKIIQLTFQKRMIRVTTLSDKSKTDVRYDLFERLNTGGISLSPQEVRACIFRGTFIDFISELAENDEYESMLKLQKSKKHDGTKEEIIIKFFAYKEDRNNFSGDVKRFLNDYTEKKRYDFNTSKAQYIFEKVIDRLRNHIDGFFLRSRVHTTPLNQFEAVLVGAGELIEQDGRTFNPQPGWVEDAELVYYSTGGTNTRSMLEGRVRRAKELLMGAPVKDHFEKG
jgi:uncharacterized protein with ParB-like and HNH nuclease domain